MKRRPPTPQAQVEPSTPATQVSLAEAFAALQTPAVVAAFLDDLCTPAELEAMRDRWAVAGLLSQGLPYRAIAEQLGVSATTVTRVARALALGADGYRAALAATAPAAAPTKEEQ